MATEQTKTAPSAPQPWSPPAQGFGKRLLGSAFAFACYFTMIWSASRFGILAEPIFKQPSLLAGVVTAMACFGFVVIAVYSGIAYPFRELAGRIPVLGPGLYEETEHGEQGLFSCQLCMGFWVGTILAMLGLSIFPVGDGLVGMRDLLAHGLFGAGTTWLLHAVMHKLGVDDL